MSLIIKNNGGHRALVPFHHPLSLLEEIEELSRGMWNSWEPFTHAECILPSTDIYEEEGQFVLKTELPGIDKKDLEITLEGDRLTVKAEKKDETTRDATHHTRERYYGQYFRSMIIPYPVKEEEVSATIENGVLEIRLPRAEEIKPKRIEVEARLPKTKRKTRTTKEK
jgi:HSP20 family protein